VVPFTLVALAIAMSAVSLYYYLQVLKRAYVTPALDDSKIVVNPVTLTALLFIALWVVMMGVFPAILQVWMQSFYSAM
jgi:NADH-quinone oxidoreductase subunit N